MAPEPGPGPLPDLNLLHVLRAVHATRSVTLAARQLCVTQSAVSNALRRLRERLDDPLFVRTGHGMAPTPLVQDLIGPVEHGLQGIEQALRNAQAFDPLASTRLFRLLGNDLAQEVFIPTLLRHLAVNAPGIRLETVDLPPDRVDHAMAEGTLDLALGHWPRISPDCVHRELFTETFVVLMKRGHALAGAPLTLSSYLAARHVDYRPGGNSYPALASALRQLAGDGKPDRHVVFAARHGLGLAELIADSGMLLTIPSRLAAFFCAGSGALVSARLPFPAPRFRISLQWHKRSAQDQATRWLGDQVVRLFAQP